ncbi:ankyrin repeat domain-containing protein [Helicobacter jaachi]|uniref:Ankyrin repeat domain-containing protein n=1 Tax=Helicobacter jaachi TaxID=1677920 RepID=A0A4U8TAA0_9HELI|nr:ankyrin repeat domain-containing protein [Helicobacter jaachi]TLD96735.1 ankyrin repeat domain-containing protein [Helicobacter jaachi]
MLKVCMLASIYVCCCFGGGLFYQIKDNPPSIEESLQAYLTLDCKNIKTLKGITPHSHYKGKQAILQCQKEQKFLKAIFEDDAPTYTQMIQNNERSKYFLYYTTHTPRLEITPLMVAIIANAPRVFELILADSIKLDVFTIESSAQYDINRVISDEYTALGAFSLHDKVYDTNGVSALDLSAMYHRYEMFAKILQKGAEYLHTKHPQNSGIVTFGDGRILDTMLAFNESFLSTFAGGHILHYAARNGNVELVEYLIVDKKMPIDMLKAGETPLDAALNARNFQHIPQIAVALKLIELGAKPSEANQRRLNKLMKPSQKEE